MKTGRQKEEEEEKLRYVSQFNFGEGVGGLVFKFQIAEGEIFGGGGG